MKQVIVKCCHGIAMEIKKALNIPAKCLISLLRGLDLNQRPSGYEPDELPGCSTPR